MNKKYIYVVIVYIAMQLSAYIGMPILFAVGVGPLGASEETASMYAAGIWTIFSFTVGLIIILRMLSKGGPLTNVDRAEPMAIGPSILWGIAGIFLAFIAQSIAISIEQLIGIEPGSENTEDLLAAAKGFPLLILVISIIGPILEEIVFRKAIFGMLYTRFSFWVSALISAALFSAAHMEFKHFLLYAAMGFVFAFLYVRTKRIIVPIIAHVMMNTLVVVMQLLLADKLQEYIDKMEKAFVWLGGFVQ